MAARFCWMFLVMLVGVQVTYAQPVAIREAQTLTREAYAAYRAEDYATFRDKVEAALRLRPTHPGLTYNLAAAYARTNQPENALQTLADYVAMGLVAAPEEDDDFAGVRDTEAFEHLLARIERNRQPVGGSVSDTAFTLADARFIPEGIAHDAVTGSFFVGSVHQRRIVRIDSAGTAHPFADAGDGLWSVLGMAADADRRRLWVCTAALAQTQGRSEAEPGGTALVAFDLDSGAVLRRVELNASATEHQLGDLTVGADGTVFATDARGGALYRLAAEGHALDPVLDPGTLVAPQGLCVVTNGALLVADYSMGLLLVDPASRTVESVGVPAHTTLLGIDGLACDRQGARVLAVQNGVRPHRVLQLQMASKEPRVSAARVLAAHLPAFDEPTLGVMIEEAFYLVANSQWGHFREDGSLPDAADLQPPVILRIALERP